MAVNAAGGEEDSQSLRPKTYWGGGNARTGTSKKGVVVA